MTPSGHKAFLVSNVGDVELLLMHNRTHAAEYAPSLMPIDQRLLIGFLQDRPQRLIEEAS